MTATGEQGQTHLVDTGTDASGGRCRGLWRWAVIALTVAGLAITVSQVFFWNPFGRSLLTNEFLYFALAAFLPIVFLACPLRKGDAGKLLWYDVVLAAAALAVPAWLGTNGESIVNEGWDYAAPPMGLVAAYVLWALVLEALRRTAGLTVMCIAGLFSIYPLFAGQVPVYFLQGIQFDLPGAAQMHVMGVDSILGLPLQTAAEILIGFLLFGVVLQTTGGGAFFHDLARSILGTTRGGSAKVSVVSSASMGMMSGSAVSNVLTTGPLTIPAMKRAGFSGKFAAGVEATASSGGSVTPPIMGTAAFLMVSFVGVPYREIALAAAIPAILYFVGIFAQVDAYAARRGLRGERRADLPRFLPTLLKGWPYIAALVALMVLLVTYQREAQAPFIVVTALLLLAALRRHERLSARGLADVIFRSGRTIAEIMGIIAGVGLIIGGLSMAGVSLSLARELVNAVGGNVLLILIAGAVTSFVLGMGMTVSAVYVLLAVVMAPALVQLGIDPIAAHLFVIYWATVSYITPPVALASFAAAGIAGTRQMATAVTAMRLGMVKYVVPFCFALNPALVGRASGAEIAVAVTFGIVGVVVMSCAFEGWAVGLDRPLHPVVRVLGVLAGAAILAPEMSSSLAGVAVAVALGVATWLMPARETVAAEGEDVREERESSGLEAATASARATDGPALGRTQTDAVTPP